MTIVELRNAKGLSQKECAAFLGIPLPTYKRYEADETKVGKIKLQYITERLNAYGVVDEEHGVLTVGRIGEVCGELFPAYGVEFCYLFGSYAKDKATEKSDVDLLVSLPVNGLRFYELAESLRERLKKKVDLLDTAQLNQNPILLQEILKDGVKIYG